MQITFSTFDNTKAVIYCCRKKLDRASTSLPNLYPDILWHRDITRDITTLTTQHGRIVFTFCFYKELLWSDHFSSYAIN